MCDVAFIQMAQVAAATAGQAQNARAVRRNALAAGEDAQAGLYDRAQQDNAAASDQMVERSRAAMAEVGTLNAIFADSGLSGNSQDRIVATAEGAAAADLTTIERNRQMRSSQSNAEGAAIRSQTESRINSAPRPSLIGAGLQIAAIEVNRRNPPKK